MVDVSVFPCGNYAPEAARQALLGVLAPLGGLEFVKPGMRVGIKVNLVVGHKPDAAATTHPQLVCQLAELLRERGAEVVVGDSPGGLFTAPFVERIYRGAGMTEVEAHGAHLNRNFAQKTAHFPEARVAKEFLYTAWLDEVDVLIDFCKLKTHGMMGLSAAAKNLFGAIPGTVKPEYHFRYPNAADFARMLVDLNDYFRPVLSIVDAVVGMEGNGPTSGTPRRVGCLLAGQNPHRVDLACAELIGLRPEEVPTLQAARERGYLPESAAQLEIAGDLASFRVPDFVKVETRNSTLFRNENKGVLGRLSGKFLAVAMRQRPVLRGAACVGCGACAEVCPAKAIRMEQGRPHIRRRACIRCFCCQEFCPKGAMQVKRPLVSRLLG